MALFLSPSLLNPSPSSSSSSSQNNQNSTNSHPKSPQLSTLRPVPFCIPSLSTTTSSPIITPILKFDKDNNNNNNSDYLFPSLSFSNIFFFKSAYNFQVIVGENEPEEKLISRFRREVFRTRLIQEIKRRRYFESTQEKKKRKSRDAARRNRKRRPQPKALLGDTKETLKDEGYKSDEDMWDFIDVEPPYT